MRNRVCVVATFIAMLSVVGVSFAAEGSASGTWKWTSQGRQGGTPMEWTLKLTQEGDKLTGAVIGGQNNTETQISDGTIKDGTISFTVKRERNGQAFVTSYSGKLAGDTITGKSERDRQGQKVSTDWVAKRGDASTTKPSM